MSFLSVLRGGKLSLFGLPSMINFSTDAIDFTTFQITAKVESAHLSRLLDILYSMKSQLSSASRLH
jgi:hypothetical protein